MLGEDERKVARRAAGDYEPPVDVLASVENMAALHAAHPPPARE
jgi:hypothetical protein